ncbi:ABC transporter ATP-binding protein [Kordiimonas sp. SCSIO 12610]|uniref:ABC transporter ATP-binding protein n=1 Tax=Kordiimonas sp. SCSIO 12610 TaxID=2829597 RepID=UPI00210C64A8|nr:ABC transporter ATP-binding protein [Kordiimonas sp. SCSIO 12610]UTW53992.1 ABC transporter ATP-binding protein [Kordiimonas sp. SCSIO 12610]
MATIHLKNIAHSYDTSNHPSDYALKPMDHIWEDGKTYALLGPSGCGKTTLLNIISGLLSPSEGEVYFDNKNITDEPTENRNIAQVFQFPVIYDTMTVRQNLAFPLKNRKISSETIETKIMQIAEMLGLSAILDQRANNLSSDAKQIISLGRGLIRDDVNAILFDEPLTMIDPHKKWQLRSKLKELHQQFGFTMVYVTHDQTEAMTFANHIVVMKDGEILQIGTPADLFERPQHTFVGHFIGSPGMNFLPVSVVGNTAQLGPYTVPLSQSYSDLSSGNILLGIRPEFVSITSPEDSSIMGCVSKVEDLGKHKIVRLMIDDNPVAAILPEEETLSGDTVGVNFKPENTLIYQDDILVTGSKI